MAAKGQGAGSCISRLGCGSHARCSCLRPKNLDLHSQKTPSATRRSRAPKEKNAKTRTQTRTSLLTRTYPSFYSSAAHTATPHPLSTPPWPCLTCKPTRHIYRPYGPLTSTVSFLIPRHVCCWWCCAQEGNRLQRPIRPTIHRIIHLTRCVNATRCVNERAQAPDERAQKTDEQENPQATQKELPRHSPALVFFDAPGASEST